MNTYNYKTAFDALNEIESEQGDARNTKKFNIVHKLIASATSDKKSVVGIDIYKYSSYVFKKQSVIPFLFELLHNETIRNCLENEQWLFQFMDSKTLKEDFISTGDGGFQVLTSPLQAILYVIHFEANLRTYNTGLFYPKLLKEVGPISLRYAITSDRVTKYGSNTFGPGIINNARLLSRDKLNRLLIDGNTHDWFLKNTNGIETIPLLNLTEIKKMKRFKKYSGELKGLVISQSENELTHISCSKLLDLQVKDQIINVHNLYIQAKLSVNVVNPEIPFGTVMVTAGSPNATGIE